MGISSVAAQGAAEVCTADRSRQATTFTAGHSKTRVRVPHCPLRHRNVENPSTPGACTTQSPDAFPEWMDLKTAQTYISISERTLREWIHREQDPLPAFQDGGKIFISRSRLDRWMLSHPVTSRCKDIDAIVNEVMDSLVEGR